MSRPAQSPGLNGDALRLRRVYRGLSREDVARACGVSAQSVGAWERGQRTPSSAALAALVRVLRTSVGALRRAPRVR